MHELVLNESVSSATGRPSLSAEQRKAAIDMIINDCGGCGWLEADRPILAQASDLTLARIAINKKQRSAEALEEDDEDDEELDDNEEAEDEEEDDEDGEGESRVVGNQADTLPMPNTVEIVANARREEQRLSDLRKAEAAGLGVRGRAIARGRNPNSAQAQGQVAPGGPDADPTYGQPIDDEIEDAGDSVNSDTYGETEADQLPPPPTMDDLDASRAKVVGRVPGMRYPTPAEMSAMDQEQLQRLGLTGNELSADECLPTLRIDFQNQGRLTARD